MNEESIAEVLALWTGIPVYKLTEEETAKLLRMEEELHKRIVGQEDAIKAVSQAIRRTRAGLKDPKRPSGSFIFLGPSGVGKTETAKALAEFLFGDESSMIQLDMSEYMEKHTVSRLVGSPPGYVGYDEGGQLTEAVRRKPFSVVLFDEIEKAHPDVFNALLQILEDGRLTDAQGRTVDFKNTVIIMTSNLGTADLKKAALGFARADEHVTYDKMKDKVHEELKRHFRPEFLNRIDDVIVFHQLSTDEITEIVDLLIKRVVDPARVAGPRASSSSPRRSCCWRRRATTRRWVRGRCAGRSSGWSRTRCRRRSCGRNSTRATRSWSTPRATRSSSATSTGSRRLRSSRRRPSSSRVPVRPSSALGSAFTTGDNRRSVTRVRRGRVRRRCRGARRRSRAATSTRASTSTLHEQRLGHAAHRRSRSTPTPCARLGGRDSLAQNVPLDDLRAAGWTISAWKQRRERFGDDDLDRASVRRLRPISRAGSSTSRDRTASCRTRRFTHDRGWFTLARRAEPRRRRALALGRHRPRRSRSRSAAPGGGPRSRRSCEAQLAVQLKTALHVSVVVHLPDGHAESYDAPNGSVRTVRATHGGTDWDHVVKFGIGVTLALLAGLFFLAATVGARRSRRRARARSSRIAETERTPLM